MSTNKHIDKICCVILAFTVLISIVAVGFGAFDDLSKRATGYELKLFDDSYVHTIEIVMDDWDSFLESCENEEYASCSVIIDNESFKNVAIRAKGNTSLSSVSQYGNNRYSFKIEFDHYDTSTYHGLDKLSLNNLIQDNTYMKDYLVYTLMREQGVAAPLCSFVKIVVNGEDFGVYLAVEGVEDSFLQRNYGTDYGELYKPDSMSMGGGRGNGKDFSDDALNELFSDENSSSVNASADTQADAQGRNFGGRFQMPTDENGNVQMPEMPIDENGEIQLPEDFANGGFDRGNMGGGMANGSSDVLLKYTDDSHNSYTNIFDNAKTDITNADKDRIIESIKTLNEGTDIEACVDIEAVIKYFVVHNFVCNFDSYTGQMIHNYYLYEKNGVMSMIPWDYNLAFGGFMSGSSAQSLVNFPIDSPVSGGNAEDRPMIAWIFNNEEYTELYHKYMSEFMANIFDSGYFEEKFTAVYEALRPYVENDPTAFCTYDEFVSGAKALKSFCELRAESISGQLDGTIPSTSEGQAQDSSALVETGELNIDDMGSMGMGGKGGFGNLEGGFNHFNGIRGEIASETETTEEMQNTFQSTSVSVGGFTAMSVSNITFLNAVVSAVNETNVANDNSSNNGGFGGRGGMTPPQMPAGGFQQGEMPQMPDGNFPQGEAPQNSDGNFPQGEVPQVPDSNSAEDETRADNNNSTEESLQAAQPQRPGRDTLTTPDSAFNSTSAAGSVISVALSLFVLCFGLIFAMKFRRYKN